MSILFRGEDRERIPQETLEELGNLRAEIRRLEKLVEDAYMEGWTDRKSFGDGSILKDWENSSAKYNLK